MTIKNSVNPVILFPGIAAVLIALISRSPDTVRAQEEPDSAAVTPASTGVVSPDAVRARIEALRQKIEAHWSPAREMYEKNPGATLKAAFEKNAVDPLAHGYISSWSGNGLWWTWQHSAAGFYSHHAGALDVSASHAAGSGGMPAADLNYLERGVAAWLQEEAVLSGLLAEYTDLMAKQARHMGEAMRIRAHPKFYFYGDPEHSKEWRPAAERADAEAKKVGEQWDGVKRRLQEQGAKRIFSATNEGDRLELPERHPAPVETMKLADSPNDPGAGEPSAGGPAQDTPADDTLDRLRALSRALHEEMLRKPQPPEELPSASSTDPETGITTTSQKNPDGSRTVTRTDPDGNVLSTKTIPPPGEGVTFASSTDPKTGITTNSVRQRDGSNLVTQTDADGNVLSTELTSPEGMRRSIASTTDPATGVTTTVETLPDGSRVTTRSLAARDDEIGASRFVAADDQGNRSDTVVDADGLRSTEIKPDGVTVTTSVAPDGSIAITEARPDGSTTSIHRTPDGVTVEQNFDADGTPAGTIVRPSDGEEIRVNGRGAVAHSTTEGDQNTETTIGPDGNLRTVTRDDTGEIVAETNTPIHPQSAKQPGQQYFEKVLRGEDWEELPPSLKDRYAASEQQLRNNAEMENLRQAQEAERLRVAEETRKFSEDLQADTDAKLAAIQREQEAADRKSAGRIAREDRQRQITESYEKSADLRRQYAEALARGDKDEARRVERLQEAHHSASMDLLEITEAERQAMDRKDALRHRLNQEIVSQAWKDADARMENDWAQGLKEDITKGTRYVSVGSALQQDSAASTRSANRLQAATEGKEERIRRALDNPSTTAEEREILQDMLALSGVQAQGASDQLRSNARITAVGYGVDALMLASGGTIAKGAAALVSKAPVLRTTVAQVAGTGALGATRRLAGERAATALQQGATRVGDAARAAGSRALNSGPGKVLTRDILSGSQAESVWLKGVTEQAAKGMVVDAGYQMATTGTVDPTEVAAGGLAGGVLGSTLASASNAIRSAPRQNAGPPAPAVAQAGNTAPAPQPRPAAEVAPQPSRPTPAQPPRPAAEVAPQPSRPTPAQPPRPAAEVAQQPNRPTPAQPPRPAAEVATQPNQPTPAQPPRPAAEVAQQPNRPTPAQPLRPAAEVAPQPRTPAPVSQKPEIVYPQKQRPAPAPTPGKEVATRTAKGAPSVQRPPADSTQPFDRKIAPPVGDATSRIQRSADSNYRPPDLSQNQLRRAIPGDGRPRFDRSVEVMDRLLQADPALAQIDRDAVVPGLFMRSGNPNLPPEAVAAAALKYQAPKVPITPERLAAAAEITTAQAEAALRSADNVLNPPWVREAAAARAAKSADVGRMARSLADTNPLPAPQGPQQPDTLSRPRTERLAQEKTVTRPQTERLVPDRTRTDVARRPANQTAEKPAVAKPKPVVEEFDPTADSSGSVPPRRPVVDEFDPTPDAEGGDAFDFEQFRREYEAENAALRERIDAGRTPESPDARKFGQFRDSPGLEPGIEMMRPIRRLTTGDKEYLASIMTTPVEGPHGTSLRGQPIKGPEGVVELKAGQEAIGVDPVNDYVVDILNGLRSGEFPSSRENPLLPIEIDPKTGVVGEGHHRLVAAQIVSRMTGRPLYGGDRAIIPQGAIRWSPVGRSESPWANVRADGLRPNTAAATVTSRRTQLDRLSAVPAESRTPEVQRQVDQLNWELRRMEPELAEINRALAEEMRRYAAANLGQANHLNHQADTLDIATELGSRGR